MTSDGLLPVSPRGGHEHVWLKYGETLLGAEREGQSEEGDRLNSPWKTWGILCGEGSTQSRP